MTERQIECFLVLAQTLSFRQTAQKLYLTQPAVSQQIRALEDSLNTTLFLREHGRVSLTAAGAAFLDGAQDYLAYTGALVRRVQHASGGYTELRELSYMMPLCRLPEILHEYHLRYPKILMRVLPSNRFRTQDRFFLSPGGAGIAFGDSPTDGDYVFTELYQGDVVCLMPAQHPLAQRPRLCVQDLAREPVYLLKEQMASPFLRQLYQYVSQNHPFGSLAACASFFDLATLARAGYGLGITPRLCAAPPAGCVCVPFDFPQRFHIGIFTHHSCPADLRALAQIAQRICAEGSGDIVQV